MATIDEVKSKAKQRRQELFAEFKASGCKNYRQFAKQKGDMCEVRYWQLLSRAAKD